jgi:hypothetical protein
VNVMTDCKIIVDRQLLWAAVASGPRIDWRRKWPWRLLIRFGPAGESRLGVTTPWVRSAVAGQGEWSRTVALSLGHVRLIVSHAPQGQVEVEWSADTLRIGRTSVTAWEEVSGLHLEKVLSGWQTAMSAMQPVSGRSLAERAWMQRILARVKQTPVRGLPLFDRLKPPATGQ